MREKIRVHFPNFRGNLYAAVEIASLRSQ